MEGTPTRPRIHIPVMSPTQRRKPLRETLETIVGIDRASWSRIAAIFRAGFHRPIDRTSRAKFEKSRDESSGWCSLVGLVGHVATDGRGRAREGERGGRPGNKKS